MSLRALLAVALLLSCVAARAQPGTDIYLLDLQALGATVRGYNFDIVGHPDGDAAFIIGVFQGTLSRGGRRVSSGDPASYITRLALKQ